MPILVSGKSDIWKDEANACFDSLTLKANDEEVNRLLATPSLCMTPCGRISEAVIMTASGCPCLELRAAPFVFGPIASQLALAISFRFGARTPCCGHGLDCGHSADADVKNKAPEQVNYIPFQRFNDPEDTTELENVNDGSFFRYELQASKASHRLAQLSQFSLNNCVGYPLNSDAVNDNSVCLMAVIVAGKCEALNSEINEHCGGWGLMRGYVYVRGAVREKRN